MVLFPQARGRGSWTFRLLRRGGRARCPPPALGTLRIRRSCGRGCSGRGGTLLEGCFGPRSVLRSRRRGALSALGSRRRRLRGGWRGVCPGQVVAEEEKAVDDHYNRRRREYGHRRIEHLQQPSHLGAAFFCPRGSSQHHLHQRSPVKIECQHARAQEHHPPKPQYRKDHRHRQLQEPLVCSCYPVLLTHAALPAAAPCPWGRNSPNTYIR